MPTESSGLLTAVGEREVAASYNASMPEFRSADEFLTTQWSLVLRAGAADSEAARQALAALCERYWYPLYAYLRRRGVSVEEAEDIMQGFFARLMEKQVLAQVTTTGGRFRSFLLTALKNYSSNERHRASAEKRGGGRPVLSLDIDAGESRLKLEPYDSETPERLFERQWALTLLEVVLQRLQAEYQAADKARTFEVLKTALAGDTERLPYAALAQELGTSEEAARQAASRLRKRYRELLRAEVASTLDDQRDIDEEIRGLFATLGR